MDEAGSLYRRYHLEQFSTRGLYYHVRRYTDVLRSHLCFLLQSTKIADWKIGRLELGVMLHHGILLFYL